GVRGGGVGGRGGGAARGGGVAGPPVLLDNSAHRSPSRSGTVGCRASLSARASELSRVAVLSARDMNTTGQAAPHRTPPKRQSAVYMIAFTVRLADSRFGNSMTSAAPTTGPPT